MLIVWISAVHYDFVLSGVFFYNVGCGDVVDSVQLLAEVVGLAAVEQDPGLSVDVVLSELEGLFLRMTSIIVPILHKIIAYIAHHG